MGAALSMLRPIRRQLTPNWRSSILTGVRGLVDFAAYLLRVAVHTMQWTFVAATGVAAGALAESYSGIYGLGAIVGVALSAAAWGVTLGRRECLLPVSFLWAGVSGLAFHRGANQLWHLLVLVGGVFLLVVGFVAIYEFWQSSRAGGARR